MGDKMGDDLHLPRIRVYSENLWIKRRLSRSDEGIECTKKGYDLESMYLIQEEKHDGLQTE